MSLKAPRKTKVILAGLTAVSCLAFGSWFVWFRFFSAEQFRHAMERRDIRTAERLWKVGVYLPKLDPYGELIRIIGEFEAVDGVDVRGYEVLTIPVSGVRRPIALLDVRESDRGGVTDFGLVLVWIQEKWTLKVTHELLPPYVRKIVDVGARSGGMELETN